MVTVFIYKCGLKLNLHQYFLSVDCYLDALMRFVLVITPSK